MEKTEFWGESDPQFLGKIWTDMTEIGTNGQAIMYDFQIVVKSLHGSIPHGLGAISLQSQIFSLSRGTVPFKIFWNLNRVKFSSPVVTY
jgi:hypothetical protein